MFPRREGLRGGEAGQRTHQATHERLHGLVADEAAPDRPGESQDAQLRDLQAAGLRVEAVDRVGEEAVHRRGQEDSGQAHDRPSRLQVSAASEAEESEGAGLPLHDALPLGIHGGPESR